MDHLATAHDLVAPGKGILAADESTRTIGRRFAAVGIESTPDTRRAYRELLFSTPGAERYLSGAILYDETIRQSTTGGEPLPALLARRGIVPGIKVDLSAHPLARFPGEKVTEGLDGLRKRLEEYRGLGARFAKWRAVIAIGEGRPSGGCISANAHALGRYAALCQECGLTPIVEPEVLMDGDHTLSACAEATTRALAAVFAELRLNRVELAGIVLKPNMVVAGIDCPHQPSVDEVAEATLRVLRDQVPPAVPGIAFLSGGQSPELATHHLDAIARRGPLPWEVTFSYGRALQDPVLKAWRGATENREEAQRELLRRALLNAAARAGAYAPAMEAAEPTWSPSMPTPTATPAGRPSSGSTRAPSPTA
jgi:fructose-bisphosphate aldolase class I